MAHKTAIMTAGRPIAPMVHPKPLKSSGARAEWSREVRLALDALSTQGLCTSNRRAAARPSGAAPFICG